MVYPFIIKTPPYFYTILLYYTYTYKYKYHQPKYSTECVIFNSFKDIFIKFIKIPFFLCIIFTNERED